MQTRCSECGDRFEDMPADGEESVCACAVIAPPAPPSCAWCDSRSKAIDLCATCVRALGAERVAAIQREIAADVATRRARAA